MWEAHDCCEQPETWDTRLALPRSQGWVLFYLYYQVKASLTNLIHIWPSSFSGQKVLPLVGSFFQGARPPITRLVGLIWCWAKDLSNKQTIELIGLSDKTVTAWFRVRMKKPYISTKLWWMWHEIQCIFESHAWFRNLLILICFQSLQHSCTNLLRS